MGSSTMMKSASWIVMMQRDKYNTDDIIRNTTILTLSKNRSQGETGPAGEIYYDGLRTRFMIKKLTSSRSSHKMFNSKIKDFKCKDTSYDIEPTTSIL